jgi:cell division septation protein DedD
MKNRQVIAIFIVGIALLLIAFWAGLSVVKDGDQTASASQGAQPAPKPPAAAPAEQQPEGDARYIVQIGGSFGTEAAADQLTAELRRKRYLSAETRKPGGADTLYRVHIGPYKTRDEAQQVARQLGDEGYKGVMILPMAQN